MSNVLKLTGNGFVTIVRKKQTVNFLVLPDIPKRNEQLVKRYAEKINKK